MRTSKHLSISCSIEYWFAILILSVGVHLFAPTAFGQARETVLYTFCQQPNCVDGKSPQGNLVFDKKGNIYGTTFSGGSCDYGVVFELMPKGDGTYTENVPYSFGENTNCQSSADGAPRGLVFDRQGNLYGVGLGGPNGYGTVFELSPNGDGSWQETILWAFNRLDGDRPQSQLIFDSFGNLYGTTILGGKYGMGTVFQLAPPISGSQWTLNILYEFGSNPMDGNEPWAGVVFDDAGNLYGTTQFGGLGIGYHQQGWGIVFKLTPSPQSPWSESILHWFTPKDGVNPSSELVIDKSGTLYGAVPDQGGGEGAVFRLTSQVGGTYKFQRLLFPGSPNGSQPFTVLLVNGTLFGTTYFGGTDNAGTVFQVKDGHESVAYSFCSQPNCSDGNGPWDSLTFRAGSLFGIGSGGPNGYQGEVFQLSPQ